MSQEARRAADGNGNDLVCWRRQCLLSDRVKTCRPYLDSYASVPFTEQQTLLKKCLEIVSHVNQPFLSLFTIVRNMLNVCLL